MFPLNRRNTFLNTFILNLFSFVNLQSFAMSKSQTFHFLSALVCLIGLTWQICLITIEYQRYDVITLVSLKTPSIVKPPAIAACFFLEEIREIKDKFRNLTAEQIFNWLPKEDEIVSELYRHKENSYEIIRLSKKSPDIKIRRFIKQLCVCYGFSLSDKIDIRFYHLRNTYDDPTIFRAALNTNNINTKFVYYFTYDSSMPDWGLSSPPVDQIIKNSTREITLDYQAFETRRLPPPYVTKCIHYKQFNFDSISHCFDECMIKNSIAQFGKIPFSILTNRSFSYPLINENDSKDGELVKLIMSLESKCRHLCSGNDCITNLYSHAVNSLSPSDKITFSLYGSKAPTITTISLPAHVLLDCITFILSYMSFWLGLSPYGLLGLIQKRVFLVRERNANINFERWTRRQLFENSKYLLKHDKQIRRLVNGNNCKGN